MTSIETMGTYLLFLAVQRSYYKHPGSPVAMVFLELKHFQTIEVDCTPSSSVFPTQIRM
jgi:hypothetical protein